MGRKFLHEEQKFCHMIQKWGRSEEGICTCSFLTDSGSIKIQEGKQKGGMHYEMGKISTLHEEKHTPKKE